MRKPTVFPWRFEEKASAVRRRIRLSRDDLTLYAVGDVHGCLNELLELEKRIFADAEKFPGDKLIVMLGDYVDRGPASAQVIEHLLGSPPEGFARICLTGNHEVALIDCLEGRLDFERWLGLGSAATLQSYGVSQEAIAANADTALSEIRNAIPAAHLDFLRALPVLVETERFVCVHAGLLPGLAIEEHGDHDLIWSRPGGDNTNYPKWVVHGHTPVDAVRREGRRVNIDTGAFHSGRLSALRIWHNKARILSNLD